MTNEQLQRVQLLAGRRRSGEPVAYIVGCKEFWGLTFKVNPAVLVPRPDTETLVAEAIAICERRPDPLSILDLGTGSGCIALAIAHELKIKNRRARILATDKSPQALLVARENAAQLQLTPDVEFLESDWAAGISPREKFNIVVSNPPYVPFDDARVSPGVAFEPKEALFSSDEGLADIKKLLAVVPPLLSEQGVFLCEIGAGQAKAIRELPQLFNGLKFLPDLSGIDRVAYFFN